MRKYLVFLGILHVGAIEHVLSQNIPNGVTQPATKTPLRTSIYSASPSSKYMRSFTPQIPITDTALVNLSSTIESVQVTTQYFDEIGRPLETVVKQASPAKKDFVAPVALDAFGIPSIGYLPYVATTGNYNDGKYKTSQFTADSSFYKTQFPNEQVYYGQQLYDGSPLNKVLKQMAPGNSWTGSSKGISYSERANTLLDSVRFWTLGITSEDDIPTSTAMYQAGSLFVREVTDERGNKAVTYTDEVGRTILTKTQLSGTPSAGHTGWLCTYYVYDEMNHLRMVISPKATSFLNANNWDLVSNSAVINNLCYSYWYDNRGRLLEKHIPNKGKMYIAYDLLDRVVMTQDENLRTTNQWTFIKYDGQSRPIKTGLITSTLTAAQIQSDAAIATDYPTLTGTYTILTEAYYDDYNWTSGTPLTGSLNTTNINSTNFITTYNTAPDYAQPLTQSNRIRGSVTGGKKLILGSSTYLYTASIYDEDGRTIQNKQTNISGSIDILTTEYNFAGNVLRTQLHNIKGVPGAQTHDLLTKYSYDHVGRLKTIIKNIDATGDKTTSTLTYNELGQLQTKALGGGLASQNYTYNVRGWLSSINKDFVETNGGTEQYFGEALFYDYGFSTTFLNGNIAGVKWKSTGDDIQRAYGFGYDKVNRLTAADFTQQNDGSTNWTSDKMDFSVSGLKYDANGNINSMTQRGVNVNTPVTIDSLTYSYFTNSNQLKKVDDAISDMSPWEDFKDTTLSSDDYVYDVNGNLSKDNNKHIHTSGGSNGITYNFLDKPDNINVNGKGSIAYTYDAAGALLQKTITDTKLSTKTVITYCTGFVYQKVLPSSGNASSVPDTLQYILHEEGRIRWSYSFAHPAGIFVYDYFLKDHLNNIRSVVTDEKDTVYYPDASLESATINNEKIYYTGLDNGVVARSSVTSYPANDTYTSPNDYIQRLRADGAKIGAGILLKVMAGDKINVHASSWYKLGGSTPNTPQSPLTDIVTALTNSIPGVSGNKYTASQLGSTVLNPSITGFLNTRDATGNSSRPNSWFNIIVLDEQMNIVMTNDGKNSYYEQVGANNTSAVVPYNISGREITKSGYVYIYVSNETPNIYTYWDNLQVTHIKGPLLQEEGYYPFGLEMKAISSNAALKPQSNYKFNGGTELNDKFDVSYYETYFRNYDPQIGRFAGIDALAEEAIATSTYQFGGNNPALFNDPTGLKYEPPEITKDWTYGYNDRFGGMGEFTAYLSTGGGISSAPYYDSEYGYLDGPTPDGSEIANSEYGGYYGSKGNFVAFTGQQALDAGIAYMDRTNSWRRDPGWATSAINATARYNISILLNTESSGLYVYSRDGGKNEPGGKWDLWGVGFVVYHGKGIGGTNFIGPGSDADPRSLGLQPVDWMDLRAFNHDIAYWKAHTGGFYGAAFNKEVLPADMALVGAAFQIMNGFLRGQTDPVTNLPISPRTFNLATVVYYTFSGVVAKKLLSFW